MFSASIWIILSLIGFIFAAIDTAGAYAHYNLVSIGWPEKTRLIEFTKNQFYGQASRTILLLAFLVVGFNEMANGPSVIFVIAMFIGNGVVVATAIRSHMYRTKVFDRAKFESEDQD